MRKRVPVVSEVKLKTCDRKSGTLLTNSNNLQNAGIYASLTLKSQDGKVDVNLELYLHNNNLLPPRSPRLHHPSPSSLRCTKRPANTQVEEAEAANAVILASSAADASPTKETAV